MSKIFKISFLLFLIFSFTTFKSLSITDALIGTVGNKPLLHSDLINEMKMLLILSGKNFSQENKKELQKVALKSITGRLIKEIEIEKYKFNNFNQDDVDYEINKITEKLNIDLSTLKGSFKTNDINFSTLENRIKTELKWNGLMFDLYKNRVIVNINEINDKLKLLKNNSYIEEYFLYEILIEPIEKEKLQVKLNEIMNQINSDGFEKTAIEHSRSGSSVNGGKLGWIKETMISEKFRNVLKNTKIGFITQPILMPEGVLILKLENKRKISTEINLEEAKNKILQAEKNKKLEMFALSHFNKIKKITAVNYNF